MTEENQSARRHRKPAPATSGADLRVVVDVHPAGDADPAVLDAAAPVLYIDDLAAVRGDGVFETLMVRGGQYGTWTGTPPGSGTVPGCSTCPTRTPPAGKRPQTSH